MKLITYKTWESFGVIFDLILSKFLPELAIIHDFNQILKFSPSYFIMDEELTALNVSQEASDH